MTKGSFHVFYSEKSDILRKMSEKYGNREGFRMPINKRNLAVSIIFTIVTCGIYGIYWFNVMTDDTKNVSDINGASGGVAFLLNL